MENATFFFVSFPRDIQIFEEATSSYARIQITAMELDKVSNNDNLYKFSEKESIKKSLIGKPVFYGLKVKRKRISPTKVIREQKHLKKVKIGFIESAKIVGNKIKAVVKITDLDILGMLKKGIKDFLFSVGGVASRARIVIRGAKKFTEMVGAKVTHLAMWKSKHEKKEAGFESARMEKLLEFSECALVAEPVKICGEWGCRILENIKDEFEEARRLEEDIYKEDIYEEAFRFYLS